MHTLTPVTFIVKPKKPGLIVRDPITKQPLPSEGKTVEKNSFWLRRVNDGDVVEIKKITKSKGSVTQGSKPQTGE